MLKKMFASLLIAGCVNSSNDESRVRYDDSGGMSDTYDTTETAINETGDTETGHTPGTLVKPTEGVTRVVLLIKDTTRSSTAHDPEVMPSYVDRVAQGVDMFYNHGSGNWTRPSIPVIMTGVNGFTMGENTYLDDEVEQIPASVPTLGERFAEAGWSTRADLCNMVAYMSEGMRGIDEEQIEICARPEINDTTALQQFERSGEWMAEVGDYTFLVMLVMESHDPFNRPAKWCESAARDAASQCPQWEGTIEGFVWDESDPEEDAACKAAFKAAYDCDTSQLDEDIENGLALWEKMGLMKNTVVYMTADHGEHMQESHGNDEDGFALPTGLSHHRLMYGQVSRVDAAMIWPDASPTVINFPTGHADVAPTLLDVASIPYDENEMMGESIFRLAEDPNAVGRIITQFACDSGGTENGAVYMMAGGDVHHTILHHRKDEGDTWATYNVSADPDEATPLVGYSIPEEIRATLQNQADTSENWACG
jgi:arylsulfatase A-like enzyme